MQGSHSPSVEQSVTSTSAKLLKLLQAAAESVGGETQLAVRLSIAPSLLAELMADLGGVPDPQLFQGHLPCRNYFAQQWTCVSMRTTRSLH